MKLFDFSYADSDHMIWIDEDLQFVEDQHRDGKMIMGEEDKTFREKKKKEKQKRSMSATRKGQEDGNTRRVCRFGKSSRSIGYSGLVAGHWYVCLSLLSYALLSQC